MPPSRNGVSPGAEVVAAEPASADRPDTLASAGPWRLDDGHSVKIVCAQWPKDMLDRIPYADIRDPDYIELLTYSDLDALFELHGRLRALNPSSRVALVAADRLVRDDFTSHLVTLGGIDWNTLTSAAIESIRIPVRQVADWDTPGGQYFEVLDGDKAVQHSPVLEPAEPKPILREDVALFARAVNPYNQRRTLTICSGMYGRGTHGAVRALTDPTFRERNAAYLRNRFAGCSSYCILTRVPIAVNGKTLTPDWTIESYRLFEWPGQA